jgi:hypothetical protein
MKRVLKVLAFVVLFLVLTPTVVAGAYAMKEALLPGFLCPDLPESGFQCVVSEDSGHTGLWRDSEENYYNQVHGLLTGDEVYLAPIK